MAMKTVLLALLKRFPLLKRALKGLRNRMFPGAAVSSNYIALQADEAGAEGQRLRAAWHDEAMPQKQRKLVEQQLRQYRGGARIEVFDVFVDSLLQLPDLAPGMSLLEIGCSSGFYSEVVDIAGLPLKYFGCDYAPAFIELARRKYPALDFRVEDGTNLRYADREFDIVVSGCCLLHIPEYARAVTETARVARRYAIFHRTPVVWDQPEQWYRKKAYGVETVEIHFNEPEFVALLDGNGLEVLAAHTLHEDAVGLHAIRTYICRKKAQ